MSGMDIIGYDGRDFKTERSSGKFRKYENADAVGVKATSTTSVKNKGERSLTQSEGWEELRSSNADEWVQSMVECAEFLKKEYPGVHFNFTSLSENSEIQSLSISLGNGVHMVISPKFIQGMISSPEAFIEGKASIQKVLNQLFATAKNLTVNCKKPSGLGAVIKENREASVWTLQPSLEDISFKKFLEQMNDGNMMRTYKEKGGRNITEIKTKDGILKFIFIKRLNYSPGSDILRLARLTRIGNVNSFIGGIQAYMNQVRSDRYLDEAEIKQTLAQMKGVALRANTKVRNLKEEEILEIIRRRSIEARNVARAEKIAAELRRRRTARKSREYANGIERIPLHDRLFGDRFDHDSRRDEAEYGGDMSMMPPVMPVVGAAADAPAAVPPVSISSVDVSV